MEHRDHVQLIREGVNGAGPIWADLGSGEGAFTLALADLLGASAHIYSIDRDPGALRQQESAMHRRFPDARVDYRVADFTRPLDLPPLDGVLMANSLHFVRAKRELLERIIALLEPGGRLLLVEYNSDKGNPWVPHPMSETTWSTLASEAGLERVRVFGRVPSRFLREIYAAVAFRPVAAEG